MAHRRIIGGPDGPDGPWTDARLTETLGHHLRRVPPDRKIGLAVSGGPDSAAMMHLVAAWAGAQGRPAPIVFSVDHGARPESADEAAGVIRLAAGLGLEAQVLSDRPQPLPKSNLQAAYRTLRYRLLADACRDRGIGYLCLAHHLDDQAETFLMRLARGSGVDGLGAMAPATLRDGLTLLRPLLDVPGRELKAYCARLNLPTVQDPSNADPRHARVRLRRAAPVLTDLGLTAKRLAQTAGAMRRASEALSGLAADAAGELVLPEPCGSLYLNGSGLDRLPAELRYRVLAMVIRYMAGGPPARLAGLVNLWAAISGGRLGRGLTSGGCRWTDLGDGRVHVTRELRAIQTPTGLTPGTGLIFDHRFRITLGPDAPEGLTAAALGSAQWAQVNRAIKGHHVPRRVGPSLPAIFSGDRRIACPLVDGADDAGQRPAGLSLDLLPLSEAFGAFAADLTSEFEG